MTPLNDRAARLCRRQLLKRIRAKHGACGFSDRNALSPAQTGPRCRAFKSVAAMWTPRLTLGDVVHAISMGVRAGGPSHITAAS
ncbi:hypothetical protein [Roseovarius ramblicola]|uniref:Uncharacterized protein n=1 Tax=Roseovarius ramblicola TaxID=2022336 RepID=A0ABV5I316_9RHOB